MAHTPGRWVEDDVAVRSEDGELIAILYSCRKGGHGSMEENRAVVAAAPDLLMAAKLLLEAGILNPTRNVMVETATSLLKAAVEKARGQA